MTPRSRTRLFFFAGLTLLFLSGGGALIAISRLLWAQQWASHTRDVQAAIAHVNTAMTRVGRARAEYVDSGDPQKLKEYQVLLALVPDSLTALKQLVRDNVAQQNRLIDLASLADQRIDLMRESVALKQRGRSSLEDQASITQKVVAVAGQMDSLMQMMQDQEQVLLRLRLERGRASARLSAILLSLTFVVACVLLILHYMLLNRELEGRSQAEISLRKLSAHILQIQDQERRKFSRDLHDSLGQYLAAAKMNLDVLSSQIPGNPVIADCTQLLGHALGETRTISHLLHPPTLDETGFASAAKWYVEGFSKRSGIQATIKIPENFDRLSPAVEIALFRVLQESLTNIHRHSRGTSAEIAVALEQKNVALKIRDNGKGIPADVLERFQSNGNSVGVGLGGMRERLRELGGRLEIYSNPSGTLLTAVLPALRTVS